MSVVNIEVHWKNKYQHLVQHLRDQGWPEYKIEQECKLQETYTRPGLQDKWLTHKKHHSIKDIMILLPEFKNFSEGQKKSLYWDLGINTKQYTYYLDKQMHRDMQGNETYGYVVYGQERSDKEWVSMRDSKGERVCSEEMRDKVRGY